MTKKKQQKEQNLQYNKEVEELSDRLLSLTDDYKDLSVEIKDLLFKAYRVRNEIEVIAEQLKIDLNSDIKINTEEVIKDEDEDK